MLRLILLMSAFVCGAFSHVILQPVQQSYAHPAVVQSQLWEQSLPTELLKSAKFYSNPRIAEKLAAESWPTETEHITFDREAEKIDRSEIGKIFARSGLHRRRRQA